MPALRTLAPRHSATPRAGRSSFQLLEHGSHFLPIGWFEEVMSETRLARPLAVVLGPIAADANQHNLFQSGQPAQVPRQLKAIDTRHREIDQHRLRP